MPAPRRYRVVSRIFTTFTELPDVLSFSADIGRTGIVDTYSPSSASITYRRTSSSTPVPPIGTMIYIVDYTTGTTAQQVAENNDLVYLGYVRDAVINWGMSSVEDTITIECESYLAVLGRNVLNAVTFSHDPLSTYIDDIETASGAVINLINAGSNEDIHTVTWSDSVASLMRLIANTVYGRMSEGVNAVTLLAKNTVRTALWKFSDNNGGTFQEYDDIRYESLGDNYYTQVQVQYPIDQVAVAGTGTRVLSIDTLARNATNAATIANYYKNTFGTPVMGLAQISALASRQSTFRLAKLVAPAGVQAGTYACVGTQMEVDFRGSVLTVIVEGVSISATPEDSRYTFYVSPGDLNSYLVLNNTVLGRLDFNRLGF